MANFAFQEQPCCQRHVVDYPVSSPSVWSCFRLILFLPPPLLLLPCCHSQKEPSAWSSVFLVSTMPWLVHPSHDILSLAICLYSHHLVDLRGSILCLCIPWVSHFFGSLFQWYLYLSFRLPAIHWYFICRKYYIISNQDGQFSHF